AVDRGESPSRGQRGGDLRGRQRGRPTPGFRESAVRPLRDLQAERNWLGVGDGPTRRGATGRVDAIRANGEREPLHPAAQNRPGGAMISTLLVDDDRTFSALGAASLQREGFVTTIAHSLHEARQAIAAAPPDLVILDRRLPDGDVLE